MLKKRYRLKGAISPRALLVHTQFFTLRFSPNGTTQSRFGFVVSKKVDKRATVRNRSKRKIRACIETILDKIKLGYDMMFFLKKEIAEGENICSIVEEVLKKEKII